MKKTKLVIEVHQKTKNSFQVSLMKKSDINDIKILRNELKNKLKDRHRIKGVFISEPKKDKIENIKKFEKTIKENLINANIDICNKDYEKIKHKIFCKEKEKEKRIKLSEAFNENLMKHEKNINYTTLKETMYKFLRNKDKSNYYCQILANKFNQKNENKIKKKNLVNKTLKHVINNFNQMKGKVDSGKTKYDDKETSYKNIISKIAESRKKFLNNLHSNRNSKKNDSSNSFKNIITNILNTQTDYLTRNKKKFHFNEDNIMIKEKFSSPNNFEENNEVLFTYESGLRKSTKESDYNKLNIKTIGTFRELDDIELIKQNNNISYLNNKKNIIYWNKKRAHTAINRKSGHKVINKPLYITKITDLLKEFNRIKSNTRKTKQNMKNFFSRYKNIDKLMKIKEDLLMFSVKQKYLNCTFPYKKKQPISKKKIFIKKFEDKIAQIDTFASIHKKKSDTPF